MCALPLALVLLAAQVSTILDRQPFRMTGPRQFAIRVASDLTNQQQYWLAYLDDQAAQDLRQHADARPTLRPRLQDQSFLYRQQAALLTRQFAMANRAGWIAIKRALDGPDEFVTPPSHRWKRRCTNSNRERGWAGARPRTPTTATWSVTEQPAG